MVKLFSQLFIERQRRGYKLPKEPITLHHGYDTETLYGKAYLICNEDNYLLLPFDSGAEDAIYKIVQFLKKKNQHAKDKGMHWFFNLDYDVRAIIKWLPEENIRELYNKSKTVYNDIKFSYLPSKVFSVSHNKHTTSFYDIAQFYGKSLNYNANKYLGGSAKLDTIDSEILGRSVNYWKSNLDEVIKYCIQDASLTARLGEHFYNELWKVMRFTSTKPFSTGSIAQQYFLANANIPTTYDIPDGVLKLHQDGYRGGRIELLQKGYFPSCNAYDIKSAYPSVMVDLLDYTKGEWLEDKEGDDTLAGIYRVKCNWWHDIIAPFPIDSDFGTIYPNGTYETIINEAELKFIRKYPEYGEVEILEGYSFNPFKEIKPYEDSIQLLFQEKEKTTDETQKLLYKLFINSIYGKTAQAIDKRDKDSNEPLIYHTGTLWNPVYANRITSLTRLQLLENAMTIIDSVIGFSTDSIHTTKAMDIPNNPKLGDFTEEYTNQEGIFLMAGIRVIGDNQKIRGFGGKMDLREVLKENPSKDKIPVWIEKPITISQALNYSNLNVDKLNIFTEQKKILNINGDKRRVWNGDFQNASEVFTNIYQSMPIPIIQ